MSVYTKDKYDSLKYKFKGSDGIDCNFSEAYQDMFVLSILDGKRNGRYIEIGSGDAVVGNNTYLLEGEYNWGGVSIDIDNTHFKSFRRERNGLFLNADALDMDYLKLFDDLNFPRQVDYLQIDIDPPPTLDLKVLEKIPLDKYRFSVITFEHNSYLGDECLNIRNESRELLRNYGYALIVGDVTNTSKDDAFEDWYIDPLLINRNKFEQHSSFNNTAEHYMLK